MPLKDVKRLFKRPDFAVVVLKDSIEIIIDELESLIQNNKGVYYEVIEREQVKDEDITCLFVVFFEDHVLDSIAEKRKLYVALADFDCLHPFKADASNCFIEFNGRRWHQIVTREID